MTMQQYVQHQDIQHIQQFLHVLQHQQHLLRLAQQHLLHLAQQHLLHLAQQHLLRLAQQHLLRLAQQHLLRLAQQHLLHLAQQHLLHQLEAEDVLVDIVGDVASAALVDNNALVSV
jgi:hypothetical protein